jgi:hypothetical protein
LCPDYLPSSWTGHDNWKEHIAIDLVGNHIHHFAFPPCILYGISCLFSCCLCPQICIARMGNYYRIQDRDMSFIPIKDSHINLLEVSCANVKEDEKSEEEKKNGLLKIDYTFGGLFSAIPVEGPTYISSSSSSRRNSQPSTPITAANKPLYNFEMKSTFKLDMYDISSSSNEVSSVVGISPNTHNKQKFDAAVANPMKR